MADLNHGINATLSINAGTAIEGILDSASMDLRREIAEARHMGDDSIRRLAGLRDCQFTAEGDFDDTIDAALFTAWDGATSAEAVFSPDGTVTYTVDVWVTSYQIRAASNGLVRVTVNLSSDGDVAQGP
jgi:hypothetical protein